MKKDETTTKSIAIVNKEITAELADPAIVRGLLATTFKGLKEQPMRQAIFEGMVRGFKFKDFLEKNVYAIPFKEGYSLVTSIDYARKRGAKAGIVGKDAPQFETDGKKVIACSVTVHKKTGTYVGAFTAEVYFDEYTTGKNLWVSKPRTMLAKVAEMHALRMACPEELSQVYSEEEMEAEAQITVVAPREPMKPYKLERVMQPEDEEETGAVHKEESIADSVVKEVVEEKSLNKLWDEKEAKEAEAEADAEKRKDAAGLRMDIAFLLNKKTGFVVAGKKPEIVEKKIMDLLGVSYTEENYQYILDELTGLEDN